MPGSLLGLHSYVPVSPNLSKEISATPRVGTSGAEELMLSWCAASRYSSFPSPHAAGRNQQCSWIFSACIYTALTPVRMHTRTSTLPHWIHRSFPAMLCSPQQCAEPHSWPLSSSPGAAQCSHHAVQCLRPRCCCAEAAPPNLPHLG